MNQLTANSRLQTAVKILCIAFTLALCYIGVVSFSARVSTLLLYIAFMIFGVQLPGMAILKNLRIRSEHASTALVLGFFTGFAFNVILYYMSDILGLRYILFGLDLILSALWLIGEARSGFKGSLKRVPALFKAAPAGAFVFFACVFFYSMLVTQYTYIPPSHTPFAAIKADFSFHAGIINALSQGYPPQNPWVDGRIIEYHYFTEMLLSIITRVLHVPSEELIMSCTPYVIGTVLSLSIYSFFREFTTSRKYLGLYCVAFFLSNMFAVKQPYDSWFQYHIYSNINSAGLGIACMLAVLMLLKSYDGVISGKETDSSGSGRKMLIFAVLIMLMTGIKGPVSIVFVGGMIGTLILSFIMGKGSRISLSLTLLSGISFVLIYMYILGAQHSNTTGGRLFNAWEVTDIFYLKKIIQDSSLPKSAALAVILVLFVAYFLSAFLVPFTIGYIRELFLVLSKRKEFVFSKVTIYACWVVGFVGMMIFNFSGHSQVYFGFAAAVLTPVIAIWLLEDIQDNKKVWAHLVRAAFLICLCVTTYTSFMFLYTSSDKAMSFRENNDGSNTKYTNVTTLEYEGLLWLRDNTPEDSLIASDRYYSVPEHLYKVTSRGSNKHFAYAIFSQRRQYLEGSGYSLDTSQVGIREEMLAKNKALYDPGNDARGESARALGVDYVVISKRFNEVGDISNADYELCFSNDEMDIYKVRY